MSLWFQTLIHDMLITFCVRKSPSWERHFTASKGNDVGEEICHRPGLLDVCYPLPLIGGGIKRCFCLTSVCLTPSVAYIGPKSRTERPRKTKIGTEIAHVTRTPLSRSKVQVTRPLQRGLNAWGECSGQHGNLLAVRNCCYVAVCSAARGNSAPTGEGDGRGHIVAAARPPTAC